MFKLIVSKQPAGVLDKIQEKYVYIPKGANPLDYIPSMPIEETRPCSQNSQTVRQFNEAVSNLCKNFDMELSSTPQ